MQDRNSASNQSRSPMTHQDDSDLITPRRSDSTPRKAPNKYHRDNAHQLQNHPLSSCSGSNSNITLSQSAVNHHQRPDSSRWVAPEHMAMTDAHYHSLPAPCILKEVHGLAETILKGLTSGTKDANKVQPSGRSQLSSDDIRTYA